MCITFNKTNDTRGVKMKIKELKTSGSKLENGMVLCPPQVLNLFNEVDQDLLFVLEVY